MKDLTKRQRQIIDISINIISERGIQDLTMKNLSSQLGISEPAIYRHFESKKK
ncbi:MAG: helix-turn-helix transcriptional regulator, partial [Spirochaetales bacterium]|nr:helix-turn-helix transcriptional regulator [Spirochaetales bacterium]